MTAPHDPPSPRRRAEPTGAPEPTTDPGSTAATTPATPATSAATAALRDTISSTSPDSEKSASNDKAGGTDRGPTARPSRRVARETRARRREAVLAGAAALRRETFSAGMWATRAPVWMWPALIVITLISGALRLFRLDFPPRLIFDETYYVKDAYSVVTFGYERAWPENADDSFNAGDPSVIESGPEYVVHPPLGKWVIGWGIDLFGADDSFGWRFSVAIVGTLTIFLIGLVAWKLFRSAFFACVAAGLLAVDGEHFVHSRTSLLDIVLMAFILLAFYFILLDREQVTKRLARWTAGLDGAPPPTGDPATDPAGPAANAAAEAQSPAAKSARAKFADAINFGPRLGARPWLIAAGISLGLATGVKWSGLYALAAFGILVVAWDVHSRFRAGVVHPWLGALIRDSIPAFLSLVPVALITYIATWTGWILSDDGWDRQWAAETPGWWQSLPSWLYWLPSLARYHYTAYSFHVGLDAEHPYMSNPWGWIVQWRPTSFYYESLNQGDLGCEAIRCSSAITSVGNPVIWGLAPVALLIVLAAWIIRRDVRCGVILAGLAATWLPWFAYQERTIFTFYTIVMVPFVVLALTYCLALLWGRRDPAPPFAEAVRPSPATPGSAPEPQTTPGQSPDTGTPTTPETARAPRRRGRRPSWTLLARRLGVGLILAAAVLAFAYFWPIYTGEVIPFEAWNNRMWNVTWR
ncbi:MULTISPECIES: dolichyl-phosphate-mannose--protein mannosyltransferase [unclassified Brevibacterium]|uniref:dolichyl-phosphate-mannose--protein mannosyltransferase n=1 Tax=unclassified Brevibacterium TaxID=2614124 RepID=UPI003631BF85